MTPQAEMLGVVRDQFGRVAYSHKTHEKMIDRLSARLLWEKRANALLVTLTAGATVDVLVRDQMASKVVSLVLSAAALFIAVYSLSRNREQAITQHRTTAHALWLLREEYLHLIGDLKAGLVDVREAATRRDTLAARLNDVYANAPNTHPKAYVAAKRALKIEEELTFSTTEIDVMLPAALREQPLPAPAPPSTTVSRAIAAVCNRLQRKH
jgi:hypothetical protein